SCNTSRDCTQGYATCAPTGFLLPSGEPERGCAQAFQEPVNVLSQPSQSLSVEELQLLALPNVLSVRSRSIFLELRHRLFVEDGAVCVSGNVAAGSGLVEVLFQLHANNRPPFDASAFSAFTFEARGTQASQLVRIDADVPGAEYHYM